MESQRQQILSGPIAALIINKASPMTIGIFSIIFFNLTDTLFISMLGTEALAGVSFTFPVTFTITSVTLGFGVALSALVGRLLGAQQQQKAARLTSDSLLFAVLLSLVICIFGYFSITPLFIALGAELSVLPYIQDYMSVWFFASPLVVIPMVGNGAIRASGDSKTPSLVMLVSGVVNGILDPILIFGIGPVPAMGVTGAALASAIAWLITLIVALYMLRFKLQLITFKVPSLRQLITSWRELLVMAVPVSLSQIMAPLATALCFFLLASAGTQTIAAYGLATRIEALLLIGVMAVNSVIPMLVGQNLGAGNGQRAKEIIHYAIRFAVIGQLVIALFVAILMQFIGSYLSPDPAVAELTQFYLQVVPFSYGLSAVPLLVAQTLNAMARPMAALAINFCRLFLILLPLVFVGALYSNSKLVFIAIAAANLIAGLGSLALLVKLTRQSHYWQIASSS